MSDTQNSHDLTDYYTKLPQCQYFVVRKKRLCRMTVRPGREYCGEHEPQPKIDNGQIDTRITCPNDPKHTCYASKLEKHLLICNARQGDLPPYIIHNINAGAMVDSCPRLPLSQIPGDTLLKVVDKVNLLFDEHIKGNIATVPEQPIHPVVLEEFNQQHRTESSRRHLRQASSLLRLAEDEGMVTDETCYVELGAGKGQLSFYMCGAWCGAGTGSHVVLIERAARRHKREGRAGAGEGAGPALRVRADLAHVVLARVPRVAQSRALVGVAKHLCGVATDYALRCLTWEGAGVRAGAGAPGALLATCCHHRCERSPYVALAHLQELGINDEDLNVILGIVSWATCGDGRSREKRNQIQNNQNHCSNNSIQTSNSLQYLSSAQDDALFDSKIQNDKSASKGQMTRELREQIGRKAKALLDWGRVLYLRERGFDARLVYYVPTSVSLENVCIIAKKKLVNSVNEF